MSTCSAPSRVTRLERLLRGAWPDLPWSVDLDGEEALYAHSAVLTSLAKSNPLAIPGNVVLTLAVVLDEEADSGCPVVNFDLGIAQTVTLIEADYPVTDDDLEAVVAQAHADLIAWLEALTDALRPQGGPGRAS